MRRFKTIRLIIILALVLAAAGYAAYMCFHYFLYRDYEKYISGYAYETGTEFTPLEDSSPSVEGMALAAENDILKLYTDLKTTEIAVFDKRTGNVTYSNPPDRDGDTAAKGQNKTALSSQLLLYYYDTAMTEATMNNYELSIDRGQFKAEKLENGIRYVYLLGDLTSPTGIVPPMISQERLQEKVLSKLGEKDAKTVQTSYAPSETREGFLELTNIRVSKVGMQKLNKIFEKAGYTSADFDEEAALAAGGEAPARTTFSVPLEYRLEGDKLVATIPAGHIVETGSGKLARIDLLSFFGAGGTGENGYILVPNGSGSLIDFNNGKSTEYYNQYVYGIDETMMSPVVVEKSEKARLPVFGIKKDKSAVFAEIESGDTLANIYACVSGNINSYNYAYSSFLIRGSEEVSMFGVTGTNADVPVLEKDIYNVDLTVSYSFLGGQDADYSGMANYYRNELISRGELTKKEGSGTIPFYLDILGGVQRQENFLGFRYNGIYPMTTFDQAGTIVDAFNQNGVGNLRVNYLGWFNGGYYHDTVRGMIVDGVLGGKKDLYGLDAKLRASGGELFGDVAIQQVSFAAEDHYNWRMENSKYYSGFAVGIGRPDPAVMRMRGMGYPETVYNVLSPKYLPRYTDNLINSMKNLKIDGISLRDMGDMVPSDKRRNNVINRQEAKQIVIGQLKRMKDGTGRLMINGGNSYSWAFATDIRNVPAGDNPTTIVDAEVPFYQMVVHGCVDYCGQPYNLGGESDKRDAILRMIEFGMDPHFVLSYQDSTEIKYTGMNNLYSTQYEIWLDDAVDIYNQVNGALRNVSGSSILKHEVFADGTKKITYDNGCIIYINPNDTEASRDGVVIPAKSYALGGNKQ